MGDLNHEKTMTQETSRRSSRQLLFVGAVGILVVMVALGVWAYAREPAPGTRLVYESEGSVPAEQFADPLRQRLRGFGPPRVRVRAVGAHELEILVPTRDQAVLNSARQLAESAGVLRFRIVANRDDHAALMELAAQQAKRDAAARKSRDVTDSQGVVVGRWVTVARSSAVDDGTHPLRAGISDGLLRRSDTGEIVSLPEEAAETNPAVEIAKWMDAQGFQTLDVLVAVDPETEVSGAYFDYVASRLDQNGMPAVAFNLNDRGAARFYQLTLENAPDGPRLRQLGIVLDDLLLSAPTIHSPIQENGLITGDFSQADVERIVEMLRAGELPGDLRELPSREAPVEMEWELTDVFRLPE